MPWGNWYASGGKSGEEPPAAVKKQMDLYREITKYSDPAKQDELMKQLLDIAADQFYVIGISTPGPLYSVVKNNHAQCLSAAVRLDLSEPGRQQYRAVLLRHRRSRSTLSRALGRLDTASRPAIALASALTAGRTMLSFMLRRALVDDPVLLRRVASSPSRSSSCRPAISSPAMPPISPPPARPRAPTRSQALRVRYGLDQPMLVQYLRWVGNALQATSACRSNTARRSPTSSGTGSA